MEYSIYYETLEAVQNTIQYVQSYLGEKTAEQIKNRYCSLLVIKSNKGMIYSPTSRISINEPRSERSDTELNYLFNEKRIFYCNRGIAFQGVDFTKKFGYFIARKNKTTYNLCRKIILCCFRSGVYRIIWIWKKYFK